MNFLKPFLIFWMLFGFIYSISLSQVIQWDQTYGGSLNERGYSLVKTTDGGYLIAGMSGSGTRGGYDIWILKTNTAGDTIWQKSYGGSANEEARKVRQTSDGGFIIAGYTASFGHGKNDVWLLKINPQGDTLWTKTYGGSGNDGANDIQQTPDGGFIIAGSSESGSVAYEDAYVIKTSAQGNIEWTKLWDNDKNTDRVDHVILTPNGGFLIGGYYWYANGWKMNIELIKMNATGERVWRETYSGTNMARGPFICPAADGFFIGASTASAPYNQNDLYFIKVDSLGKQPVSHYYGGGKNDYTGTMTPCSDGGYLVVSNSESFGEGKYDIWLLKTDADGDTLWTKTIGGPENEFVHDVLEIGQDTYLLIGATASTGAGGEDLWLVQYGPDILAPLAPANLTAGGTNPSPWQNNDSFEINWNNPGDADGIARAYYKRDSKPTNALDYQGILSPNPPVFVAATRESGQNLFVWLEDSLGYLDFNHHATVELRYDQSKPSGSSASSVDSSSKETFTIVWSTGSDLGGSGIASYKVRNRQDAENWSDWLTNVSETRADFTGTHNHTYSFEVAAVDAAGNQEDFTGIAETGTVIDTTRIIDQIPPLPPTNLVALPHTWSKQNNFSIQWSNPAGDDLISGAFYKIGSPPSSPDDGVFIAGNIREIGNINVPASGIHSLYLWLMDQSGNYSQANRAMVKFKFDNVPPILLHTPVTSFPVGIDIALNATTSDNPSGLQKFRLYYRKTGDQASIDSADFIGNQAVIPSAVNGQRGLEYCILSADSAGNEARRPVTGFFNLQAELSGNGGMNLDANGNPVDLHYGSNAADYRIFSVPFELNDKKLSGILEDDLGAYDPAKWRFFAITDTAMTEYPDIKDLSIVEPGRAFLLITTQSGKSIDAGAGFSPKISDHDQLGLGKGWNLIGNPFDFDIPIDSLRINGNTPEVWYVDDTGWMNYPEYLKKWEGVAVYSDVVSSLHIGIGNTLGKHRSFMDYFDDSTWGIQVAATGKKNQDLCNFIGFSTDPKEHVYKRFHEPPRLGSSLSLFVRDDLLPSGEWQSSNKYSSFVKSLPDNGSRWSIQILPADGEEHIQLTLTKTDNFPADYESYLIDSDLNLVTPVTSSHCSFTLSTGERKCLNLEMIIGKSGYCTSQLTNLIAPPTRFELKQNFPNPFNPRTCLLFGLPEDAVLSLEVYNILGQKIKTLLEQTNYTAGVHLIEWDGTSDMGTPMASGIYIFRLTAGNDSRWTKGILIK